MKNILVTIDFSDLTTDVIAHAAAIATAFGGELHLLHVAEPDPDFVGYDAGPQSTRDAVAERLREQHRKLQTLAEQQRSAGIGCEALLVQGAYVQKIIAESEKLKADLIVTGAHGKGLLSRVLLGSVSEGVLRESKVPVLVVPAR
jgi:nucleotide-binding universal stress UspA family protein